MTTPTNRQIADELERLSGAFEIDLTTHPPRIRVTRDIGSISTLDELFRNAAAALREEGGERGELEPCPFCGGAPEVSTADDSGDDWYRVECLCGATVGGSHVYDFAVANWNRRAALREEGGEPRNVRSPEQVALGKPSTCPNCNDAPLRSGAACLDHVAAAVPVDSDPRSDASKPSESDEFVEAIYDILCNYRTQTREDCRAVAHKIADLPERTTRIN